MSRVVAVSHRVLLPDDAPSAGGLARSLHAALSAHGGLWFGWDGTIGAAASALPRARRVANIDYLTLPLAPGLHTDAYLGFSNDVLWPTLHGLAPPASTVPLATRSAAYRATSRTWAAALQPQLRAGDLVWIHDYQLLPLAAALRERGHTGPIGFFLHVPFPAPAQWHGLPMHAELLRALLHCDLLGFQTARDHANFRAAAADTPGCTLSFEGASIRHGPRRVATGVYPVGVDVNALRQRAAAAAGRGCDAVQHWLGERRLVAGIDRLDYTKGLLERIAGYDTWLRQQPGAAAQTGFVQVTPPSRTALPAYARTRAALASAVAACNAQHRDASGDPVLLVQQALPHDAVLALLAAAQVACVTPLVDGMNLVAQEFVAVQRAAAPGVLLLGRGAGAAQLLTDAVLVDAGDPAAISAALTQALRMPLAERQRRLAGLQAALHRQSLRAWHERFLGDLAAAAPVRQRSQRSVTYPGASAVTVPTGT
jgi:trehalose 6-phosphate synthase